MVFVVKGSKECHFEYLKAVDLLLFKNISKYIHKSHKIQLVSYLCLDFFFPEFLMTSVESKIVPAWFLSGHSVVIKLKMHKPITSVN